VVALAALLSFSRGGVIALVVATGTVLVIYWKMGIVKNAKSFVVAGMVGAALLSAVMIYGHDTLASELESVQSAASDEQDFGLRKRIWTAGLHGFLDFPFLGTGVGSHREVYHTYFPEHFEREFSHAESGYVQILLESGSVGFALLLAGIGVASFWFIRSIGAESQRVVGCAGAIAGSFLASLIHSAADFVWYIPACMSLMVVFLACACRLAQLAEPKGSPARCTDMPGALRMAVCVAVIVVSGGIVRSGWSPALASTSWDRYRAIAGKEPVTMKIDAKQDSQSTDLMIGHLHKVLAHDRNHARANRGLAGLYLRKFELLQQTAPNPMPLVHIRDAALASRFPSKEALDQWLEVAVGPHRQYLNKAITHAQRSVRLSPLQGEAYAILAQVSFLLGLGDDAKMDYVDQAVAVRPHSGVVLLVAGGEAVLRGDFETTLRLWKIAFHKEREVRDQIIDSLAQQMPAEQFIETFEPDLDGLQRLYDRYGRLQRTDDVPVIAKQLVHDLLARAEQETGETRAASLWLAHHYLNAIGQASRALQIARRAIETNPAHFSRRRDYAILLVNQGHHAQSVEHLNWCLRRTPSDDQLRELLSKAQTRDVTEVSANPPTELGPTRR
jgi:tetratricopeptide (TPR) repeat protein